MLKNGHVRSQWELFNCFGPIIKIKASRSDEADYFNYKIVSNCVKKEYDGRNK